MSNKTLYLTNILMEIINEIGDLKNIQPLEINGDKFQFIYNNKEHFGKVSLEDVTEYRKHFQFPDIIPNINDRNIVNIDYTIDNSDSRTFKSDYKMLVQILKTVVEILKDKIIDKDTIYCIFNASRNDLSIKNSNQKYMIYSTLLSNHLDETWISGEFKYFNQLGFFITKKR